LTQVRGAKRTSSAKATVALTGEVIDMVAQDSLLRPSREDPFVELEIGKAVIAMEDYIM